MPTRIGEVEAIYRYPVKSMRGQPLTAANVGWHGVEGDRRLGLRRLDDRGGFPWLNASKLPELLLFTPQRAGDDDGALPASVLTPEGAELDLFGAELAADLGRRHGLPVEMTHLNRGIFDEASISMISATTVGEIARLAGVAADARRFRPNILLASNGAAPFAEEEWVGGVVTFGEEADAVSVAITNNDVRCSMINLDPDTARPSPEILKTVVRARENKAGVYGAVTRCGRIAVGQSVYFHPAR